MVEKFKNKYRISSVRLKKWDYSWHAPYFVTICTNNKELFFGNIFDGVMHLSEIGEIVQTEWLKTKMLRPDMNLELLEFVVMPDHFHGIIVIGENKYNNDNVTRDAMHRVSTSKNQFGPQKKNLASIMRGFKSSVTKNARKINPDFEWQSGYHEHIIRNNKSLDNIINYIIKNPINWTPEIF
jgi:REP element-mobilizing transposase RayT